MRGLIVFAALLCAAAGNPAERSASEQTLESLLDDLYSDTSSTISSSTATIPPTIATYSSSSSSSANTENLISSTASPSSTLLSLTEEPDPSDGLATDVSLSVLPTLIGDGTDPSKRRRIVTYDQRQEGQYNIRADLDNFVILFIPENPTTGLSIFDLFRKYRRSSHTDKNKKRQYASSIFSQGDKNHQAIRNEDEPIFTANARSPLPWNFAVTPLKQTSISNLENVANTAQRLSEYIEGRTPYHVDISANDDEQSRHPNRQVDVLPPPYPLAYQHLIKPYHLEAEPNVIQALPPSALHKTHVSTNFLESYNKLLNSGLQTAAAVESEARARNSNISPDLGYYRISRSIRSDNAPDSDPSSSLNSLTAQKSPPLRFVSSPIYRSENSMGAAKLYPPIDVPRIPNSRTLNALDDDNVVDQILDGDAKMRRFLVALSGLPRDDVELELDSSKFRDQGVELLLSRDIERCAPGHRRDSYGMCREIEGY